MKQQHIVWPSISCTSEQLDCRCTSRHTTTPDENQTTTWKLDTLTSIRHVIHCLSRLTDVRDSVCRLVKWRRCRCRWPALWHSSSTATSTTLPFVRSTCTVDVVLSVNPAVFTSITLLYRENDWTDQPVYFPFRSVFIAVSDTVTLETSFQFPLRAGCSKHRLELTTRLTWGISPVNSWRIVPRQNPRVNYLVNSPS